MYGYALPVWNLGGSLLSNLILSAGADGLLVDASKSIIFATKNHLGQNFGVMLGWMISWMVILSLTVIFQRRRTEAANMKAKWQEMKERDAEKTGRRRASEDDQ